MRSAWLSVEAHPGVVTLVDALHFGATLGLRDGWAISPRQCTWARFDPDTGNYRGALAGRRSTEVLSTLAGDAYELTLFGASATAGPVGPDVADSLEGPGGPGASELRWVHGHGAVTVTLTQTLVRRPEAVPDVDGGGQPMAGAWRQVRAQPVRYSTWPPTGSGVAPPGWAVHGEARTSLFCLPAGPGRRPAGEMAAWEVFALDEESGAWRYHDQITDRLHHPRRR